MSSHGHAHTASHEIQPADPAKIRKIWVTAGILGVITAIEFIIAFVMDASTAKTVIFILLTFVKCFYIVGEFMHLKYEVKLLVYLVVIPAVIFVSWFVLSQLAEGSSVYDTRVWIHLKNVITK